ncbi:MAG: 16S rRNA (cytosine(1402)-N(4))-methyltransferase RsmH [Actinobacteria bacterium]|nr:16S rRNA (cytosine(1402)-N(4))-methyltransferase RsmH [Actinomycetota bacterium]
MAHDNAQHEPSHVPVLLERCLELLAPAIERVTAPVMVDATLGLGGHSFAFLQRFPSLTVIGLDHDAEALAIAQQRLSEFGARARLVHARNDAYQQALRDCGVRGVHAALFDLGVSSMQLDLPERGFAYSQDAPLDMRMDARAELTAAVIVNTWDERDIARVLRDYSGEKFARPLARAMVRRREVAPLRTTSDLVELIYDVIPAPARRTGGHPAKRTFQALRVAVNDELGALRRALPQALEATVVGGRLVVMAYQSDEDRIVKAQFAQACASNVPEGLVVTADQVGVRYRLLTRGSEKAPALEIERNPRAASVRLRAIERVAA